MTALLVRGSTDRLRLDWANGIAEGPDGTRYIIQKETVRYEGVAHYAVIRRPGVNYGNRMSASAPVDCPYGYEASMRDQKRVCEFDAWDRAGRPG